MNDPSSRSIVAENLVSAAELHQRCDQQLGGVDRLQKIVAGGGKKARLGRHRCFGPLLGQTQLLLDAGFFLVLFGQALIGARQLGRAFRHAVLEHLGRARFKRDVLQFQQHTALRQPVGMKVQHPPRGVADAPPQPSLPFQTIQPRDNFEIRHIGDQPMLDDKVQQPVQIGALLQHSIGQAQ